MKSIVYNCLLLLLVASFSACEKDPVIPNEEELITSLIYTLTPQSGGDAVVFSFRDLDGDGGLDPVVMQGMPKPDQIYNASIQLLNESVSPALNITNEITDEGEEHQFFYTIADANAMVTYIDSDTDNNPIGIATTMSTGQMSDGILTITLRHLPDKFAAGVKQGDITNAGGETDIEVTFPLFIE